VNPLAVTDSIQEGADGIKKKKRQGQDSKNSPEKKVFHGENLEGVKNTSHVSAVDL